MFKKESRNVCHEILQGYTICYDCLQFIKSLVHFKQNENHFKDFQHDDKLTNI